MNCCKPGKSEVGGREAGAESGPICGSCPEVEGREATPLHPALSGSSPERPSLKEDASRRQGRGGDELEEEEADAEDDPCEEAEEGEAFLLRRAP